MKVVRSDFLTCWEVYHPNVEAAPVRAQVEASYSPRPYFFEHWFRQEVREEVLRANNAPPNVSCGGTARPPSRRTWRPAPRSIAGVCAMRLRYQEDIRR